MLHNNSCIKIAFVLLVSLLVSGTAYATTLISPTGDGGLETGATFLANGWTEINGANNMWYVGNAPVVYAGTNCAFTSINSTSWEGENVANVNHFYRDITIPAGEDAAELKFWYKVINPDATYDFLKVFLVPTTTTPVAGTQLTSGQIGVNYESAITWTEITINFSVVPGTTQRLVFSWRTDGVSPAAAVAVDNISLVTHGLVPLVGGNTYPINGIDNPPVSFANIASAMSYAAGNGVTGSGQVLLELSTGYTNEPVFPITANAIPGVSSTLGVTIRPAVGTSPFNIEGSGTSIFNFNGVKYLTIDGRPGGTGTTSYITFSNTSTTGSGILLTNGATNNTVRYCTLKGAGSSSYGVVDISTSTGATGNNYNTFEYCDITKSSGFPYYGVRIYGSSGLVNTGNVISHCKIYDFSNTGVYVYSYCNGTVITDNDIYTLTQQSSSTLQGVDIHATTSGGSVITNNRIHDFLTSATSPYFRGIYLYYGSTANVTTVANNFICLDATTTHPGAYIYGIHEGSGSNYLFDIYFNSIYIGGTNVTGGTTYGIYRGYACIMNFKNNIIFNNRMNGTGTTKHYCFYASNTSAGLVSNYNDFYAPNDSGYTGYWGGYKKTLADWQTASNQDVNSVSQNPNYVNVATTDLHINSAIATRLESGGVPIAGITSDIDGDMRAGSSDIHNNVQPDIGADEFNGIAIDEMPPAITYTPLMHTPFTTNRTLVATITDYVSGLANDPARAPRLYYRKGAGGNWVVDTVLTGVGNNWTFTFDHSKIGGVVIGDTVFYYVQATDSSNNTGTNPIGGATTPNSYRIIPSMAGNYNIGTGQTYTTLREFFTAINNNAIIGNVTGTITSDLTETMSDTLYQLMCFGGDWRLTIKPALTDLPFVVSGAIAGPLICLNGADNITFDGLGKNLVFRNSSTSGKVFQLVNDATYNTITSCVIEGCGTSTSYATIYIYTSTGTLGNSYNVISNNDIRDLSTTGARQYCAIYIYGSATALNRSNTISNNNIFNYSYYGIYVGSTGNGGNWTISGNSFYYNNATAATTATYAIYFYPSTTGDDNLIYGNFIGGSAPECGGAPWNYAYSGYFYSIYVSVGTITPTIVRKNTIKNITLTATGASGLYGIYFYAGTAIIDSNTIGDPTTKAHFTQFVNNYSLDFNAQLSSKDDSRLNYDIQPPEPNTNDNVSYEYAPQVKMNNLANSIVNNGTGVIRGIYIGSSVVSEIFVENNEICNLTATNTGTGAYINGIYNGGGGASYVHIRNNRIHDLTVNNTATSMTAPSLAGIVWFPGTSPNWAQGEIVGNTIYSLVDTNMTAVASNVMGMMLTNCAATIIGNQVYNIRNYSTGTNVTTPPTASGFYIRFQSGTVIANNMVSVGEGQSTNTQFHAFWNGAGSNNYYAMINNSALVTGTAGAGDLPSFAFMRGDNTGTAITTVTYARNNIFINNRTGGNAAKHYAIGNKSTEVDTTGWDFDYNILKSANPATFGLWGSTDLTFADWKLPQPAGTGGDAHSINDDPGYMSITDLHISPTSLVPNRKAIPIEGLTFDFDNEARHPTNPDIGADEYTPNAPQEFTLISPVNGAITQPLNGQLVWHKATLAEFYDVYLDVVNPPLVKMSTMQMDTTYSYVDLLPNTTYYWKVIAHNDTAGMCPGDGSISSDVWSFATETWDASPVAIIRPLPISFAGNIIIPRVKIKNFGTGMITSFNATMTIASIYASTKPVTNLMPGDSVIVDFDPWTAVLGNYDMKAWTSLEMDYNHTNDTVTGSVEVQAPAHNVGTMAIISPAFDTTLEGTVITPIARIKNFGAFTENFVVRFKIGTVYNETIAIVNFVENAETTLIFPNWTATHCNYVVSCSTELASDQLPEDDAIRKMLTVQYYDVGVSTILIPTDTVNVCHNYTPVVVITNNSIHASNVLCTLAVRIIRYPAQMISYCNIGRAEQGVVIYESEYIVYFEEMPEGNMTVTMPDTWHPYFWDIGGISNPTYHEVIAFVKTANDMNSVNNDLTNQIIVQGQSNDLQMNWTGLLNGYNVMHSDTIANVTYNVASAVTLSEGGPNARFRAWVKIIRESDGAVVYTRYKDVTMNAGTYYCIPFSTGFTATEPGSYIVRSWIEAKPGVDIIAQNSIWERRYYITLPLANANNSSNPTVQGNARNIPTVYRLMPNNPNPFSNLTNIQWQIPEQSNVVITIYDATGRNIKTLVKGNQVPGYYSTTWNRTDDNNKKVPAGIYFFEMKSDKYTARRKMVITN